MDVYRMVLGPRSHQDGQHGELTRPQRLLPSGLSLQWLGCSRAAARAAQPSAAHWDFLLEPQRPRCCTHASFLCP